MTRKKNISKTWQANLPKWPPKHTTVSRKPTVDDVMDSKLESNFDSKDSEEIQSDAELLEFAMRLQEAHDRMVTEEKAKWADKKRKSTYSGNSDRSKWRWQLQGQRAEEAGFPSEHIQNAQQDEDPEVDIFCQDAEEAPPIENGNYSATTGTEDEEEPEPETLDHHDLPALHRARAELVVRHKKKNLDLFFQV
ncbi:hypothetical protein L208DRAFT_1380337 [Tricholoma matsutake]|nr:hypothetical protein L208DRAFT_1380337 [Tricholoma matsutake 945]